MEGEDLAAAKGPTLLLGFYSFGTLEVGQAWSMPNMMESCIC